MIAKWVEHRYTELIPQAIPLKDGINKPHSVERCYVPAKESDDVDIVTERLCIDGYTVCVFSLMLKRNGECAQWVLEEAGVCVCVVYH